MDQNVRIRGLTDCVIQAGFRSFENQGVRQLADQAGLSDWLSQAGMKSDIMDKLYLDTFKSQPVINLIKFAEPFNHACV
ncbi:MAG TPA: hypothetical protein PKW80_14445 [Bacteroidales bacterium]|nr:hypothetical protein [Bacteroidales bacterium]